MRIFGHSAFIPVFLGKIVGKNSEWPISGHSEFIPVFLGKIVGKNLEQPFLAILNLYQSFWEKLLEKNLERVRKILEWPFLAILNVHIFLEKIVGKIQNGHFWQLQIYTSLFGKNCQKKFGMAIFGHSECIHLFGKNCQKKFRMAIFGHSEFIPVFFGKIVRKNLEWPFLAILNFF